jgi:repressor LexA
MERNGFVHIDGGGKRGLRRTVCLTTQGKHTLGIGGLRVFGSIPAGPLMEVLEQCDTVVDSAELLPHRPGDFLLIVRGDSMVGDGILPNDKVLLRPHVPVRDREIAAVHIGDECMATLKHVCFGHGQGKITLRASNPKYKDIMVPSEDVKIAGVFRGLIRSN